MVQKKIPGRYISMWSVAPSDDYVRRHKRYEKKRVRELRAGLDNLDTFLSSLRKGLKVQQVKAGFLHLDPLGVLAIDQKGGGKSLVETRLGQKDSTIVNKIKYHALAIKGLLAELVKLAQMDKQIAAGVAGFHGEAFFNLIQILRDSANELPRRDAGTAFVDIEIETAKSVAGHLSEASDGDVSDDNSAARAEMAGAN
jgi:hypothetical protein